ncbi:hypothetical protein LPB87_05360 [Flavobacterium sp. EDS]|uniref:hypothetical protein n=1 Tax=Flavobacterium sp. EDS TaxID=2897328 RepID=UPI001E4723C5|nr:hypothetical protein [Flavobacterium sp. EDS]MCD0473817.1 hypothetical protein [Flavobacterium sp. EDS]
MKNIIFTKLLFFFGLISLVSCNNGPETIDEFAEEITNNIKNKDSEGLYALFLSPKENASYGFASATITPEESSKLKSSEDLMKLIIRKGTQKKPDDIKRIDKFISEAHTVFDWNQIKSIKTESALVETKKVNTIRNKVMIDATTYDLKIVIELNDNKVYRLKVNKAMKVNNRWVIYPTNGFGIEIEK